jgi:hypothetical protein
MRFSVSKKNILFLRDRLLVVSELAIIRPGYQECEVYSEYFFYRV